MSSSPVSIEYLLGDDTIEIYDAGNLIIGNRRAEFQLKQDFDVAQIASPTIKLNVQPDLAQTAIENLIELFEFLDIDSNLEKNAKSIVDSYLDEKRAFDQYSNIAKEIWLGAIEAPILKDFTNVLLNSWPRRTLYKLQLLAAVHLAFSQNACNFSVPGSGKTSTVLGAFTYLRSLSENDEKYVNKLLVVGPLSCFHPWEYEFETCFGYAPNSFRISGQAGRSEIENVLRSLSESYANKELILITYQSLASYIEGIKVLLARKDNRFMVVLDEAHRVKNTEGGLWASSALSIAPDAKSRVVLTGTPAPNGYQDLYNLFEFIWPGRNVIGYLPGHLRVMTERRYDNRRSQVIDNVAPFFVRISKSDLDIPDAVENSPIYAQMGPVQRKIYDYIENVYLDYFRKTSTHPLNVLVRSRQIRLMQAASNPALLKLALDKSIDPDLNDTLFIDDTEILEYIGNYLNLEIPIKFVKTLERVEELLAKGKKVLIWCYYVGNIIGFSEYLAAHSINCRRLYGAVPSSSSNPLEEKETRESIIAEFHNADSDFQVIVANPYAVGESISLHQACQHAIYFERNFNAAVYLQSKDRIHRVGMPVSTTAVYDYIQSADSVEDTIDRRLAQKIELMMEAVESREIPLLNLTQDSVDLDEDDLNAIIADYISRKE